jgi:protease-4
MLDNIHQRFIEDVVDARGDRLADNSDIFSGLIWTADQAYDLGLIDGYASASLIASEILEIDDVVDYTIRPNYWERITGYVGTAISSGISQALGVSKNLIQ